MPRTYHLWTIGCQMNAADSRHLASQLEAVGYAPTPVAEDADLVVLNTCVVRQQSEDKIYGRLGSLKTAKEKNPDMTLALMGCMVGVKEARRLRKQFPFVDVFMPPSETEPLLSYIEERELHDTLAAERALRDAIQDGEYRLPAAEQGQAVTAFVPVVLGCSHSCAFCIIPSRRGGERSRAPADIRREVESLVEQGVREVMLLGQIVDRYGIEWTGGPDLADLLRDLAQIEDLWRIRFLTSHPNWMTDKLLDTVAELDKCMPHIEVPVQAGDDEVLERMRRGYTAEAYRALVGRIRARMPDAAIHTDIIVGFPGETEAQFERTHALLAELELDKVHLAKYSPRPKTISALRMADDVAPEEKERRRRRLDELQTEILVGKNRALHGQTARVLVEDKPRQRWRGRTPHNKLVFFSDERDLRGQIVPVTITESGPFSLIGEAADRPRLVRADPDREPLSFSV